MAVAEVDYLNGGGGGSGSVEFTTSGKITGVSNLDGEYGGIYLTGQITTSSAIANGETIFTISPAPSTEQSITNALQLLNNNVYRNVKVKTNGDVTLDGENMTSGYTWKVNIICQM